MPVYGVGEENGLHYYVMQFIQGLGIDQVLAELRRRSPGFGRRRFPGKLKKLRRTISLLDSTVIELVANCMDWAKHRRRKAAAKCHLRLNLQSFLPRFAIVESILARGVRRGDLRAGLDLELARDLLLGPIVFAKLTRRLPSRRAPRRAERLVDLLLGGLAAT